MKVKTLSKRLSLSLSPLEAYSRLTNNGRSPNTILLETAEAGSHTHQKSVIGISNALKISARNDQVELLALNDNGEAFLDSFNYEELNNFNIIRQDKKVTLTLNAVEVELDEKKRLSQANVLDVLKIISKQLSTVNAEENSSSRLLGVFSFDLVDQFETLPKINKEDEDYIFYLADQLLLQTKNNHSAKIIVKGFGSNAQNDVHLGQEIAKMERQLNSSKTKPLQLITNHKIELDVSDEAFKAQVHKAQQKIIDGDIFQVVLSRNYQIKCQSALDSYQALRASNPSPYMYFINFGDKQLFGASPESCLKINSQREVSLYPIAGTRKRAVNNGKINYEKDSQIEFELIADEKEAAEHMMLVDLARNDIARVSQAGSRKVTQLKKVVKYSHVMHLVSEVQGVLHSSLSSLDAYRACANMGTLTGAPKIKAMEIIRQYEKRPRGFYGGAVAILDANDEFDSAIIIRSAVVKNNIATITAGAGIVYDSIPQGEAKETDNKAQAVINACQFNSANKVVAA